TLKAGERREEVIISLSGKEFCVYNGILKNLQRRELSSQLIFYDFQSGGSQVQLMVDASNFDMEAAEFTHFRSDVKRGDIVGVTGFPVSFPFVVLRNCFHMMPRAKAGLAVDNANTKVKIHFISAGNPESYTLKDQETRYRKRYMDLMLNEKVPQTFRTRAKVVSYIRRFLEDLDFLEVETPMMNMIAGGATAKPFNTYHNDPKKKLFMQFTTCEFDEAYADYYDLMEHTEKMLSGKERIDMIGELEKMASLDISKDLSSDITNKYLLDVSIKFDVKCPPPQTTVWLLDKEMCVNPTFIIDHPEIMSPLAKSYRSKPGLTERFELFMNKHEVFNAYTELNDPVVQCEQFAKQLKVSLLVIFFFNPQVGALFELISFEISVYHIQTNVTANEVTLFPAMKHDESAPKKKKRIENKKLISLELFFFPSRIHGQTRKERN
ncbi:hypothetical protein MKW94_005127, partial [Papaver nudicaule]|nr:hypothetical protein [Papaver nudicaule]